MTKTWARCCVAAIGIAVCATAPVKACEADHWITSVANDGKVVVLEDSTIWEVSDLDTINSRLWLALENVTVCDDELVNTDDGETVSARQLR